MGAYISAPFAVRIINDHVSVTAEAHERIILLADVREVGAKQRRSIFRRRA